MLIRLFAVAYHRDGPVRGGLKVMALAFTKLIIPKRRNNAVRRAAFL
jgi:hypothetical protein